MIDGGEFLSFFGMALRLGMHKSEEKKHLRKNFHDIKEDHQKRNTPGFSMGVHRWEAILDSLKPEIEEFKLLSKLQNKAHATVYDPGSELSVDDGIIPYHLGYKTKLRSAAQGKPAPIIHCPTKPHPYGFLTH